MSAENKTANKVTEAKGKIKKKAGEASGDTGLEAEDRAEEAKGDMAGGLVAADPASADAAPASADARYQMLLSQAPGDTGGN